MTELKKDKSLKFGNQFYRNAPRRTTIFFIKFTLHLLRRQVAGHLDKGGKEHGLKRVWIVRCERKECGDECMQEFKSAYEMSQAFNY